MTASKLRECCDEDKSQVSRSIEYLESEGFLLCNSKTKKRYNCPLILTEKGLKMGKFVTDKIDELVAIASTGLDEENRTLFYECLTKISDNLQKICDGYGDK